jgi:hypothetical protein
MIYKDIQLFPPFYLVKYKLSHRFEGVFLQLIVNKHGVLVWTKYTFIGMASSVALL